MDDVPAFAARSHWLRLFVAIELPDSVRTSLEALPTPLPGVHWHTPEKLHLTLKFIGEVDASLMEPIAHALGQLRTEPFLLTVGGVGCFPQRGQPQVLWAGLETTHPRLFQLQTRIENALFALGIEPDSRVYFPHLTLARTSRATEGAVRHWLKMHRDYQGPSFRVRGFSLLSSHASSQGHTYQREAAWDFVEGEMPRTGTTRKVAADR